MSGHPQGSHALLKTIKQVEKTKHQLVDLQNNFCKQLNERDLDYTNKGLVFGIHVNNGIYIRRELQQHGYLIRQANNTLLFLPMFIADNNDYTRFFDLVATLSK